MPGINITKLKATHFECTQSSNNVFLSDIVIFNDQNLIILKILLKVNKEVEMGINMLTTNGQLCRENVIKNKRG